jgi:O-antigen ligase
MEKLRQLICWLIYGFVFLLPFQTRWIYQQGQLNGADWEYGTFSLYATEALFLVVLILGVFFVIQYVRNLRQRRIRLWRKESPPEADSPMAKRNQLLKRLVLFFSILAIFVINVFIAINREIAFYKLEQIIAASALFFVIWLVKPDFKKIAWSFALSGLVQGALVIQQFVEQKVIANKWLGMAEQLPATLGVPIVQIGDERWLRAFGSFPHPNFLAGFLVIALILTLGLFLLTENRKHCRLLLAISVVQFLALLTALSRAGIIVFVVGAVFLLVSAWREKALRPKIIRVIAILLFIGLAFSVSYPELVVSRVRTDSRVENLSNAARVEQYREWSSVVETNWFTGVGLGNYTVALSKLKPNLPAWAYQPVHNVYLLLFAELGLFGLTLCLLFLVHLVHLARLACPARLACFTCLVCLACLAVFDHYLWSFWSGLMLASIVLALALIES